MVPESGDPDTPSPPWEVVRWTKLKKMNGQAFSEVGKRNFGVPTCIAVSASIVLGTSKGIILIFDYHQNLKSIIGQSTKGELYFFLLLSVDTDLLSRRIRGYYLCSYFCGPFDCGWRPCEW